MSQFKTVVSRNKKTIGLYLLGILVMMQLTFQQ